MGLETAAAGGGGDTPSRGFLTPIFLVFLASAYFSIAVNSIALGLMAIGWLALCVARRKVILTRTPLDLAFLLFAAAELLATIFSPDPLHSAQNARRLLLILIVYFTVTHLTEERLQKVAVATLLGSAAVAGLIGTAFVLAGAVGENGRLGIFRFYMTTAGTMTIAALMTLPFVVHPGTPRKVRLAAGLVLLPVVFSLYSTVTRGAYLAAAAGALVVVLLTNRRLVIPLAFLIVVAVVLAPPFISNRIMSIADPAHPENVVRLTLWGTALRIFADHPLVGVGDIDLGDLLREYAPPGYPGLWGHVHNNALQFLVTLGAIGFLAVLFMFVRIWAVEWGIYRRLRVEWFAGSVALGALAVFVGVQVHGLTEWTFGDQEVAVLLWVSVGLALAAGNGAGSTKI